MQESDAHSGDIVCSECGAVLGRFQPAISEYEATTIEFVEEGTKKENNHIASTAYLHRLEAEALSFIVGVTRKVNLLGEHAARRAAVLLRLVRAEHIKLRGDRRIALRLACLSIACRHLSLGVSDREICVAGGIGGKPVRVLNRHRRIVIEKLHNIALTGEMDDNNDSGAEVQETAPTTIVSAREYCVRFCGRLHLNSEHTSKIKRIAERLQSLDHMRHCKCVTIICASIIFFCEANSLRVSITRLCEVADTSRVTIARWLQKASNETLEDCRARIALVDYMGD